MPIQNYSFYDLIVTKARGKSGPLFHFDVHDDVRMTIDARIEKDEVRVRALGITVAAPAFVFAYIHIHMLVDQPTNLSTDHA